jgi:uncharacterized protein (TIGR02186 family)
MKRLLGTAVALLIAATAPASAERLIVSVSRHQVRVNSSFDGTQIVLFGSVERDAQTVQRRGPYDIVVTVTGPKQTMVTRRKERVLGIWVNMASRTFVNAPSYLHVFASRPFDQIAAPDRLRRWQIGIDNVQLPQQVGPDLADTVPIDPFRQNFVRLKTEHGMYGEKPNGVTLLTPNLLRADIPIPAEAPFGNYDVDVKLLADGQLLTRTNSAFEIVKVGFEQFVATAARDYGLLYGIATTMMALLTGWFASVVFRRD